VPSNVTTTSALSACRGTSENAQHPDLDELCCSLMHGSVFCSIKKASHLCSIRDHLLLCTMPYSRFATAFDMNNLQTGVREAAQRRALVDSVLDGDGQQQQAVDVAQVQLFRPHLHTSNAKNLSLRSCSHPVLNPETLKP
jgi:hypothetical protein